jgi:hypothetical protein
MAFIALISRQEKIKYSGMDNLRNFHPNVNAMQSDSEAPIVQMPSR